VRLFVGPSFSQLLYNPKSVSNTGSKLWAQQAGISRLVGQSAHGRESHIRGSRRQPAIFEVNSVTGDNCLIEGQPRL